jgi:hypothetical protein
MLRQCHAFATRGPETAPVTTAIGRRQLLATLGLGVTSLWSKGAGATLVRGLTLEALSKASDRIIVGTALDASSHWETTAKRRRIVTDTRVRVDSPISGSAADAAVLVRTEGGRVGSIGELVFGEAELVLRMPCVLFLVAAPTVHHVVGMAQGHFPVRAAAQNSHYLAASPRLPEMLYPERSAARRLIGRELAQAKALIREARGS